MCPCVCPCVCLSLCVPEYRVSCLYPFGPTNVPDRCPWDWNLPSVLSISLCPTVVCECCVGAQGLDEKCPSGKCAFFFSFSLSPAPRFEKHHGMEACPSMDETMSVMIPAPCPSPCRGVPEFPLSVFVSDCFVLVVAGLSTFFRSSFCFCAPLPGSELMFCHHNGISFRLRPLLRSFTPTKPQNNIKKRKFSAVSICRGEGERERKK